MDIEKTKLHEKLVALLNKVQDNGQKTTHEAYSVTVCMKRNEAIADYLIAHGVTVKVKKEKPPVDLTNKCGSCKHSVPAVGIFGNSTCYVRCTNKEHLSARRYQGRPLVDVRQRTVKACKKYEPRPPKGE